MISKGKNVPITLNQCPLENQPGIAPRVSGVCRRTRYWYERALCGYVGVL